MESSSVTTVAGLSSEDCRRRRRRQVVWMFRTSRRKGHQSSTLQHAALTEEFLSSVGLSRPNSKHGDMWTLKCWSNTSLKFEFNKLKTACWIAGGNSSVFFLRFATWLTSWFIYYTVTAVGGVSVIVYCGKRWHLAQKCSLIWLVKLRTVHLGGEVGGWVGDTFTEMEAWSTFTIL